jgi:SAM-dependent methyltransferase
LTSDGAFFEGPLFLPAYWPLRCGDWELRLQAMGMFPGYWSGPVFAQDMPILLRGRDSWMSITPLEIESQEIGVRLARGHVLIFGLGMGWAAAATAANPAVTAVTIVERDPEVIALHHALDPFAQLPEEARAKLRLIEGDALGFVPDAPVDLLMPDIWLPLVGDGRLDEVRHMQANVGAAAIYFWGQELEIARHAVATGHALDDAGIAATAAGLGLPLIGLSSPDHAKKLAAAARQWMRGRWLPGSPRPW